MVNETQGQFFDVVNKTDEAQEFRVNEYLKDIEKSCEESFVQGYSQGLFKPRKKFRFASFGHTWEYLGVDAKHRQMFLEKLKLLVIINKYPVTVTFSDGSDYDFKLKW